MMKRWLCARLLLETVWALQIDYPCVSPKLSLLVRALKSKVKWETSLALTVR